ncbi:Vesicle transport protein SFT2A [Tritrichomonas foetus]|uniref:Vesicle transport protein n=1 Tax=Tritrichomonas foetus TaxID=1144522 RepID=A0A1J4K5Q9_9EUKA|nr:Vesicle transport protein SFT2A [Tritrichomonas foetus]|eukprot:OHT06793.1 Vesicle transport protein SFT2A [Tritrichomonas foetus]
MASITESIANLADKDDNCCDMSMKTRFIAGGCCIAAGFLLSFLSFISLATFDITTFAIIYSLGSIAAVAGSFFIAGPKTHIAAFKILAHIVSTAVLVGAIIMVFISACAIKSTALAVIFVIVQLVAMFFFSVTLKTTTWTIVKGFITKVFSCSKK